MAAKSSLKPASRTPSAPALATKGAPVRKAVANAAQLRQLAKAEQSQPPAVQPAASEPQVTMNFRISATLAKQLSKAAEAEETTQKVVLARALQGAGFDVPDCDLLDRRATRRW